MYVCMYVCMQGIADWSSTCSLDSRYPFVVGCDFVPDQPLLWYACSMDICMYVCMYVCEMDLTATSCLAPVE